jgi:hypothetical protein
MTRKELLAKVRPQVEEAVKVGGKALTDSSRSLDGLLMALRVVDEGLTLLNRIDQEFTSNLGGTETLGNA